MKSYREDSADVRLSFSATCVCVREESSFSHSATFASKIQRFERKCSKRSAAHSSFTQLHPVAQDMTMTSLSSTPSPGAQHKLIYL